MLSLGLTLLAKLLVGLFLVGNIVVEYKNHKADRRPFRESMISFYFSGLAHRLQVVSFALLTIGLVLLGLVSDGRAEWIYYMSALMTVVLTVTWKMIPEKNVHAVAAGIVFLSLAYLQLSTYAGGRLIPACLGIAATGVFLARKEPAMAEKCFALGLTVGLLAA